MYIRCNNIVWVILRRCSPMFSNCDGDGSQSVKMFYISLSSPSNLLIHQQNKKYIFVIHDLIRQTQVMWFHVKSVRVRITMTSSSHHHAIVKTALLCSRRMPAMLRSQLAQSRPGCEHGRDLSPWRAPGTVVMNKSSFTDTLPELWRVTAGARPAIGKDLFSLHCSQLSLTGSGRGP